MITRLAVLPYPPLLVPELTVRSDPRLEQLRSACLHAVTSVTDAASEWVAVGVDRSRPGVFGPGRAGTFAGFGVDVAVSLDARETTAAESGLPLPALMAGWFRAQAGADQVTAHVLDPAAPSEATGELARRIAADARPVGVLVLSEGSRCRDERSPHPPHPRAADMDARLATALACADVDALRSLGDAALAEVRVDTAPALGFLAAAAEASGRDWRADLLYDDTPFGVTYQVAVWSAGDD